MAQQVKVILTDDLDGSEAVETVAFSLDGVSYEIDLSEQNAANLRKGFEKFIPSARKAKATGRRGKPSRTTNSRERSADIREWAKGRGIKVNDRGRIPATVVEQYEAAH